MLHILIARRAAIRQHDKPIATSKFVCDFVHRLRSAQHRLTFVFTTIMLMLSNAVSPAAAQNCPSEWLSGGREFGAPGLMGGLGQNFGQDGKAYAMITWDPDGSGPRTPCLVVAGQFRYAVDTWANNIAMYDPATARWSPLGDGLHSGPVTDAAVYALAVMPDGDLVAGGNFLNADGVSASRIARYDSATNRWSTLGVGVAGDVLALAVMPNGDLIAGGSFSSAGGSQQARYVARWNGSSWSRIGDGLSASVYCLKVMPDGDLIAGGLFDSFNNTSPNRIARWDGTAWKSLGTGMNNTVRALAVMPNGDLVASGSFTAADGQPAHRIARWNGMFWASMDLPTYASEVRAIALTPNGALVAGDFQGRMFRWSSSGWSLGSEAVLGPVRSIVSWSASLSFIGGDFSQTNGKRAIGVCWLNGSTLSTWDIGIRTQTSGLPAIYAIQPMPDGGMVIGGSFASVPGLQTNSIARRESSPWGEGRWTAMGAGLNGTVRALALLPSGDLIAGGSFTTAGSPPSNYYIARWNGSFWFTLGAGLNGEVYTLLVLPNGDMIAGGSFSSAGGVSVRNIARWDGHEWHAIGAGVTGGVSAITTTPNGEIIALVSTSSFFGGGGFRVQRFDPVAAAWITMGTGSGSGNALLSLPNGDILVGGSFSTADGAPSSNIARLTASAWVAVDNGTSGPVSSLVAHPNGDVVMCGGFTSVGGINANRMARYDPATNRLSQYGSGLNAAASALAILSGGDVVTAGQFMIAGGRISWIVARYSVGNELCRADFDCNESVDIDDVLAMLEAWFAQNGNPPPAPPAPPAVSADFDGNNTVDVVDLFGFLDAWFAQNGVCG